MTRPVRKLKLRDVAEAAGVSAATVDRVLNRRPGVRAQTVAQVEDAVRRLGYRPNSVESRLARGREMRLVVLLPTGPNAFMRDLEAEVRAARRLVERQGARVEIRTVDVFDGRALAAALRALADAGPDGVAVVALDDPMVREAVNALAAGGVHVVTLVSDAPGSRRARFVGVDNFAAGRTAGRLIGRFLGARSGPVGIVAGSLGLRDHLERRIGFEQVIGGDFPDLRIVSVVEGRDDFARVEREVRAMLARHPDLVGLYSLGAGNRGAIAALEAAGRGRETVFVAHELTEHTRAALAGGVVDAVVRQDPGHEARSALRVLMALATGEEIDPGQERIRIEVFLKDNLV